MRHTDVTASLDPRSARRGGRSVARVTGLIGLVYGTSVGLLFVGELLLARHLDAAEFGQYNLVRQGVPVVVVLALLGYDQALTRETAARGGIAPRLDRRQWRLVALAVVVAGAGAGYLVLRLGVAWPIASTLVVGSAAIALSSLVSGALRASHRSGLGALAQQGHRLLAGVAFIGAAGLLSGAGAALTFCMCALIVAAGCVMWSTRLATPWVIDDAAHRTMRRLGVGYSLSMLTLATGDWVDLALAAELSGNLADVGQYGQLKLLALYPVLSIGSILGFVALPAIATRRATITRSRALRWTAGAALTSLAMIAVAVPASRYLADVLFHVQAPWALLTVLGTIGGLRLFYVLPSAYLGAVAPARWLLGLGAVGATGLLVQVVVTVLVSGDILLAVACGLLGGTLTRVIAIVVMSSRLLSSGEVVR
jgi:O-antigen/teichoic acid export membrane protein